MTFRTTRAWTTSLAPQPDDPWEESRERLRGALTKLRERAAQLASMVQEDLQEFTVHDITHLDALWELVDIFLPPERTLTPPEAFVLGGTFLVHDLAMSLHAYPGGISELQTTDGWRDALVAVVRAGTGRPPTADEINNPTEPVIREATALALRTLHASRARILPTQPWRAPASGDPMYLIEDAELRSFYGPVIGRIAASHGMPAASLATLDAVWPPPGLVMPNAWTVDELLLAAILRIVDAAHLDQRRAPLFLAALRQPRGTSAAHWLFQQRLSQPFVDRGRVVFRASPSFTRDDVDGWWAAHDALKVLDRELRGVENLLRAHRDLALTARGVAGIEDPESLAAFVGTSGWRPFDVRVRSTAVAELVDRLGGQQLYGNMRLVPLRELIQNARDAVQARQTLQPGWHGHVTVAVRQDAEVKIIELRDDGVGMSANALKNGLLNFGVSYWSSPDAAEDLPGLGGRGFEPAGRFGIGFFSVFMWARRVCVTTNRYDEAARQTRVLEMEGTSRVPLLRDAAAAEQLPGGGTTVTLYLDEWPPELRRPFIEDRAKIASTGVRPDTAATNVAALDAEQMVRLCTWLTPALDVDLQVEVGTKRYAACRADDWLTIEPDELVARIEGVAAPGNSRRETGRKADDVLPLAILTDTAGEPIGRAALALHPEMSSRHRPGVIVSRGGVRLRSVADLIGVLAGEPADVARSTAELRAETDDIARWATLQARHIAQTSWPWWAVPIIAELGGDLGDMPAATAATGHLTLTQIGRWAAERDRVILAANSDCLVYDDEAWEPIMNFADVLRYGDHPITEGSLVSLVRGRHAAAEAPLGRADSAVVEAIVGVIAASWNTQPNRLIEKGGWADEPVGTHPTLDRPLVASAFVVTRP
jgi:hypothetical protein